jgi:hypothetical protein
VNLAARSSIAVLVEIGCYTVVDLGVSTGSSDGCEGNGGKLHFCCCVLVCCCVLGFCVEEEKEEEGLTGFLHENSLGSSLGFVHASSFSANHWFYRYDAVLRLYVMTSGHRLAQWNTIYKEAPLLNSLKLGLPSSQSHTLISKIRPQDIHLCSFLFWAQLFLRPVKVPSTVIGLHLRAVRGTLFVFGPKIWDQRRRSQAVTNTAWFYILVLYYILGILVKI